MKPIIYLLLFSSLLFPLGLTHAAEHMPGETIVLDTQKGSVSLNRLRGNIVYVDFWASWCGPCRKSFPWMQKMQSKYADNDFLVLAINLDDKRLDSDTFLKKFTVDFTIAYDPKGQLANIVQLKAMPSSFLLNRKGEVISHHLGFQSGQSRVYEEEIREAIGLNKLAFQERRK